MNNKKWIKYTSVSCFALFLIFLVSKESQEDLSQQTTYQIKDKKLITHQTTVKEKKQFRLPSSKIKVETKNPMKKILKNMNISKNTTKPWKQKLAKSLLRFQNEKTKVFIREISYNKDKHQKTVIVSFRSPRGDSSFTASVNMKTGKIINTWGRTILESHKNEVTFRL